MKLYFLIGLSCAKVAVVVGAGPAGLLSTIKLLKSGWYVELFEKQHNKPAVDRPYSWRFGITDVGLSSLQSVDGLWEFIEPMVLQSHQARVYVGPFSMSKKVNLRTMDRNEMVQLMYAFIDQIPEKRRLTTHFETEIELIAGRERTVWYWENGEFTQSQKYDVLIGADGARSVVRNNLFSKSSLYECSQTSIASDIKSAYVKAPSGLDANTFSLFPKGDSSVVLIPAGNDHVNLIVVSPQHNPAREQLLSRDWREVQQAFKRLNKHLGFSQEACQSFIDAQWRVNKQVTCSPYILKDERAVLIGDAAHQASPFAGLGLNTALKDAEVLVDLLTQITTEVALELYEKERLKVGHAITYLSFNMNPLSSYRMIRTQLSNMLGQLVSFATGGYIKPPPLTDTSENKGADEYLAEGFAQGSIQKNAVSNFKILEDHRWRNLGILKQTERGRQAQKRRASMFDRK